MIITTSSLLLLAFSTITIILVLIADWKALGIFKQWGEVDQEERYNLEKGAYLASAAVIIALVIRLFMVPQFFWTMQGFIPSVPGAMCLWGVFNLLPQLAWGGLAVKIIVPVAYIGWLLVSLLNSWSNTNPVMKGLMGFFLLLSPLALLDSALDIAIMWSITPTEVTCCSNAIDVGIRPIPSTIAGFSGQLALLGLFFVVSAVFILVVYFSRNNMTALYASLGLSLLLAYGFTLTLSEVLTPWLLNLPFHYCPFCLLFLHMPSILFTLLYWVGISGPWWILIIERFRGNPEIDGLQHKMRQQLAYIAMACMSAATFMIAIDLLATL